MPLRGKGLRDRYVLRLIAAERAIHVLVLSGLAVAVFLFIGHRQTLKHDYVAIINGLFGASGGPDAKKGLLGDFRHLFVISPSHLYDIGFLLVGYATLEAFEMVGLWFAKRWAEYLTFLATLAFVPVEVYELTSSFGWLKLVIAHPQPGRRRLPAAGQAVVRAPRWARGGCGPTPGRRRLGGHRPAARSPPRRLGRTAGRGPGQFARDGAMR